MNIKAVDLNLILALAALLDERNVSRAAAKIGRSQPATSSALARLRETFQDPLLVRDARGYRLTPRAEELRPHVARAIAALTATFQNPADFDPATAEMVVRIAASDYLAVALMPPLIAALARLAPGLDLRVVAADRHSAVTLLREGKVDVSLAVPEHHAPDVMSLPLFEEGFVMMTRPDHPYHDGPPTAERFVEYPGLLVSQAGDGTGIADESLAQLGLKRRIAVTVAHFLLAPYLVTDSNLVLVIGRRMAEVTGDALNLRMTAPPFPMPAFTARMFWHASTDNYAPLCWLRQVITTIEFGRRQGNG